MRYERESSDRRAWGSVAVGSGIWWTAELVVPLTGDQSALLTLERWGPRPEGAPTGEPISLVIYPGEADAVVGLLDGLMAQARQEGVLQDPSEP